jgi:hypothetical protein
MVGILHPKNHVLMIFGIANGARIVTYFVDCTYTGSLFQWYSCSLDTCQTHLITVRMSATCGFMELAGFAQLDDQYAHSRPERLLDQQMWHSCFGDKTFATAFSFHFNLSLYTLDCNTKIYCCCTNDDVRNSSLAVTLNTIEVHETENLQSCFADSSFFEVKILFI